ncbi:MAG TPA: alpha-2-macroglobulin family protein, partial [Armatimonadota bacterium]|nr:alpha-2-macroglobulin family protein [Armatimonadota bacterium]
PQGQFKTHEWVLPEGMGMMADWPGGGHTRYNFYYGRGGMPMDGGFGGGGGFRDSMAASGPTGPPGAPAPAAKMSRTSGALMGRSRARKESDTALADGDGTLAGAETRSKFADTAFWTPAVVTDAQGNATVEVTWPDNLTQWRAHGVGTTTTAQVGSGETRVVTKKDLLVRLQAPRFFVERDLVVLSANVHNYTPANARVKVQLQLGDDSAEVVTGTSPDMPAGTVAAAPESWVEVGKDGEKRVDWVLRVQREGQVKVRMTAQSPSAADAMEMVFPILVHGVERQTAESGVLRGERKEELQLAVELPAARKAGSSEVVVQLNPSMGAVMLDALPYLLEYPYGCIEQTVSRFLPAVVVRKTLKDAGYNLEDLAERARVLEEKQREGDAARPGGKTVENSAYSYPKGRPGTIRIRHLAQNRMRWSNPVFDSDEMANLIREGLGRVREMQNGDGGWGWWPGNSSDPYMTAYTLYALLTARAADVTVDAGMLERGLNFLRGRYLEDDNFHRMAFEARVLAMDPRYRDAIRPLTTGRLYGNRERLSAYSKALLALALHDLGDAEK